MQTRKYTSCMCLCGFSIAGFGEQPKECPRCGRRLKRTVHKIPTFIHVGAKVNYSSVIGEAPDLKGCYIESDIFMIGAEPCVVISGKSGAVAVAALSSTWDCDLKCYFCRESDTEQEGTAIVAHNSREAKKFAHKELFGDWIDLRVKLIKGADVSGLKAGDTIDGIDGLYRGCYSYARGECPRCLSLTDLSIENGEVACSNCHEALSEAQI